MGFWYSYYLGTLIRYSRVESYNRHLCCLWKRHLSTTVVFISIIGFLNLQILPGPLSKFCSNDFGAWGNRQLLMCICVNVFFFLISLWRVSKVLLIFVSLLIADSIFFWLLCQLLSIDEMCINWKNIRFHFNLLDISDCEQK